MKNNTPEEKRLGDKENSRCKILMITPFHKLTRGNAVTASRICAGMAKKGWDIDFYSLEQPQEEQNLASWENPGAYGMIHGFHALYMSKIFTTDQDLKQLPLLLTMTGTDLYSLRLEKDHKMIGAMLDLAAAITVFNADYLSFLQQTCPQWGEKTVLIPQGVALQDGRALTREDIGVAEKDFVFILPSGLRAIKNIDMAADGIEILQKRGYKAKLIVAGPTIEPDYAAHIIGRFDLNPDIIYLGSIEHADMKALLLLADVVINCSQAEGQPQAALEAMSLGKPCILTAVPGNLNIIENYREGIYVRDGKELASAMEFYLKEPEQLKTMGIAAQELIAKQFTAEAEMNLYNKLYQSIVKQSLQ